MKLAQVYQDFMVLQRNKPILIFGTTEEDEEVVVKLNKKEIFKTRILKGEFRFYLPALEACFNATLEINDQIFNNVDIGDVFYATGQSNMEFEIEFEENADQVINSANDEHLRMYTVGQYFFKEERSLGYKNWHKWDKWYTFTKEHAKDMSAVATHFALKMREHGVPVGILNVSVGGTTASAWIERKIIENDDVVNIYSKEWDERVASLDINKFNMIKSIIRPAMANPLAMNTMNAIKKYTFSPSKMNEMMAQQMNANKPAIDDNNPMKALANMSIQDFMIEGPGDANEVGTLFENMVKEVLGYSINGMIYYQGETDERHPDIYERLMSLLIKDYRTKWNDDFPIIFAQLAPYGTWREGNGNLYPILRKQQENVSLHIDKAYITSISDIGNVFDIHPKNKKTVGERMALLANRYIYNEDILADAPKFEAIEINNNKIIVSFKNSKGLYIKEKSFDAYNGFKVEEIPTDFVPPVLDGVNSLVVSIDGNNVTNAKCYVENDKLVIECNDIINGEVHVSLANMAFYEVNIYNQANLPVHPFYY